MKNLPMRTLATRANRNGIKYRLRMMGAANSSGSLTANITGTTETADGLELLGAHKEQEDDRDNERGAGAAEFADVVTEVFGQGEAG